MILIWSIVIYMIVIFIMVIYMIVIYVIVLLFLSISIIFMTNEFDRIDRMGPRNNEYRWKCVNFDLYSSSS